MFTRYQSLKPNLKSIFSRILTTFFLTPWLQEVDGAFSNNVGKNIYDIQLGHSSEASITASTAKGDSNDIVQISFSDCYQRYMVQNSKNNLENSFLFLDEALERHPNATVTGRDAFLMYPDEAAGSFVSFEYFNKPEQSLSSSKLLSNREFDEILYNLSCLTANPRKGGNTQQQIYDYLKSRITKNRLQKHHTKTYLKLNYDRVMDLFTRSNRVIQKQNNNNNNNNNLKIETIFFNPGLAMDQHAARNVISSFPQLCLYDYNQVEERIKFLMSSKPLINNFPGVDWPRYSSLGYGAGLTSQQATYAIQSIPQILSLNYHDSKKYSLMYFLTHLRVTYEESNMARLHIPQLIGSEASDACSFAYLHYKLGIGWDQCRILLDAFPILTFCDLEVGWEIEGISRDTLNEDVLVYLRKRLQVGTKEVLGMMKTHSRLSTYSVDGKIKPTLDTIQSTLALSSRELRQILLRMPSLIGMGVNSSKKSSSMYTNGENNDFENISSFHKHLDFFLKEANMTLSEVKSAILKQPSLLQYSIDTTLRPKLHFLLHDLCISPSSIPRIIKTSPAIMGLSLSQNLRITADTFAERCDITLVELGEIITTSPPIITLSLKGKIEPCLSFLNNALNLSTKRELGDFIQFAPRILLQSIKTSIIPKLQMLEYAVECELKKKGSHVNELMDLLQNEVFNEPSGSTSRRITAMIVRKNPSILCSTNDVLRKRLDKFKTQNRLSLIEEFSPSTKGRKRLFSSSLLNSSMKDVTPSFAIESTSVKTTDALGTKSSRSSRAVLELSADRNQVLRTFSSAMHAANELGVSRSLIYASINRGLITKGRKFEYANQFGIKSNQNIRTKNDFNIMSQLSLPRAAVPIDVSQQSILPLKWEPLTLFDTSNKSYPTNVPITVYVSSSVYPLDSIKEVRGQRRSGGLSIYFPQIHRGSEELQQLFEEATSSSFGMIMPKTAGGSGSDFSCGIVSWGFPFLRPSRNRCDLYACYAGLKVILQLLKQAANRINLKDVTFDIDVCTDSGYVWNLLQNPAELYKLGKLENLDGFLESYGKTSNQPISLANPELLYPLLATMAKLIDGTVENNEGKTLSIGVGNNVQFIHSGEMLGLNNGLDFSNQMMYLSKRAAMWQFERAKKV